MMWPIADGRGVLVPSVGRSVVIPLFGGRPALGDPPFFDPIDPADVDLFAWDWSIIAFPNDAIIGVTIICDPPLMMTGSPVIFGRIVQSLLGPLTAPCETIDLTCQARFATGRVLDWGVRLSVANL